MGCFRAVYSVMIRTRQEDLRSIVTHYQNGPDQEWSFIVDALGAAQTNSSLQLLNQIVFASEKQETFNITMAALAQVIRLDKCPPKVKCYCMVNI